MVLPLLTSNKGLEAGLAGEARPRQTPSPAWPRPPKAWASTRTATALAACAVDRPGRPRARRRPAQQLRRRCLVLMVNGIVSSEVKIANNLGRAAE